MNETKLKLSSGYNILLKPATDRLQTLLEKRSTRSKNDRLTPLEKQGDSEIKAILKLRKFLSNPQELISVKSEEQFIKSNLDNLKNENWLNELIEFRNQMICIYLGILSGEYNKNLSLKSQKSLKNPKMLDLILLSQRGENKREFFERVYNILIDLDSGFLKTKEIYLLKLQNDTALSSKLYELSNLYPINNPNPQINNQNHSLYNIASFDLIIQAIEIYKKENIEKSNPKVDTSNILKDIKLANFTKTELKTTDEELPVILERVLFELNESLKDLEIQAICNPKIELYVSKIRQYTTVLENIPFVGGLSGKLGQELIDQLQSKKEPDYFKSLGKSFSILFERVNLLADDPKTPPILANPVKLLLLSYNLTLIVSVLYLLNEGTLTLIKGVGGATSFLHSEALSQTIEGLKEFFEKSEFLDSLTSAYVIPRIIPEFLVKDSVVQLILKMFKGLTVLDPKDEQSRTYSAQKLLIAYILLKLFHIPWGE